MSKIVKTIIFGVLLFLNLLLINSITMQKTDWGTFFPKNTNNETQTTLFTQNIQYLFISMNNQTILEQWLEEDTILNYYQLNQKKDLYLLLFNRTQQTKVLQNIKPFVYSGTSVLGEVVVKNFQEEFSFYLLYIAPILLLLFWFLSSYEYLLNILLELFSFNLILLTTIKVLDFHIDIASLMTFLFLFVYAFTLFHYIYSKEFDKKKLQFGIGISIFTTLISAIFLTLSQFGFISSFGATLILGLITLLIYTFIRLHFLKKSSCTFRGIYHFKYTTKKRLNVIILSTMSVPFIGLLLFHSNLHLNLNPLTLIGKQTKAFQEIENFESNYINSLPIVIELSSKDSSFKELKEVQQLHQLVQDLQTVPTLFQLYNPDIAYKNFASREITQATLQSYAQFLLANELSNSQMSLFSSDMKKSYIYLLIPITTDTYSVKQILQQIDLKAQKYPQFDLKIKGKVSDFHHHTQLFLQEFASGLSLSLGFIFLFFLFYCRSYKTLIIIISALVSFVSLLGIHALFNLQVTLMTLLSVILFSGLVTDNIVHIFICYKEKEDSCFNSVTKPIIVSNISMLLGLGGMFFGGSLLFEFALELGILLTINLLFILYILPSLLRLKVFKNYTAQGDSYKTMM
ncbi:hypothetical protein [Sulfurimonas sp.]|uniref:hypothetical protein n=1 Tax=Sulfurimonas sp. TaxID=2022749 RepID=UPI003D150AF8